MEEVREYLISLICASIICSIVKLLIPHSGKMKSIIHIMCGLFMGITALSPVINLKLPDYHTHILTVYDTANQISREAAQTRTENMARIIKDQTEAYILEKADSLDMDVAVEVKLNEELLPERVVVVGAVAPYDRKILENYIQQTLDVPEEQQLWKN